ncbi:acyl-CoA N-acyltransferase [Fusarium acuminatum]|uniref:Acyl-CoA N-acyltransferase n=1 Tax=Fusarium acuminatum TaxID=5515 RepID=A0ABZ2WRM0_9HYPO
MSSITIRPATLADSDAIANIHSSALEKYNDFYAAFFQRHPRELIPIATRNALQNPKQHFLVAEEAGQTVGFVRYTEVKNKNNTDSDNSNKPNSNASEQPAPAPGPPAVWTIKKHMEELWQWFNARSEEIDASKEKAVDGRDHFEVMHIMVDPQHQRKGIGGHLLKSVTDKADAVNAPTLIVSSVEGHGLYSKHGFESLGTWDIDNEAWAHKIVEHEKSIGYADGVIDLEDKCRGMRESEDSMIRQPIIRS